MQVDVLDRGRIVEREHLLLKVERTVQTSEKLVEIANVFHANILNVEPDSMILELTGDAGTINSFIELYNPYDVLTHPAHRRDGHAQINDQEESVTCSPLTKSTMPPLCSRT